MFCFWFLITNQWLVIHHPCSTVFAFGLTMFCNDMDRVQFWFPLHINLFVCTLSLKRFVGSSLPAKDLSRLTECYKKWTRQNLFWFGGNRGGWGEHWGGLGAERGWIDWTQKIWIYPGIGRACDNLNFCWHGSWFLGDKEFRKYFQIFARRGKKRLNIVIFSYFTTWITH